MRVTRHPYAVDGWGVGELWVGDGRIVVAHDPPSAPPAGSPRDPIAVPLRPPRGTPRCPYRHAIGETSHERLTPSSRICCKGSTATSPASADSFADVELDLDGATRPSSAMPPRRCAPCRGARSSPTASWPSSPAIRAPPGRPARSARDNRFSLFVPCHRVVGAGGIGCYGSLGVDYKRRLLGLEGHAAL